MFIFRRNRSNRRYTLGRVSLDKEGDPCLKADRYGEKIKIEHGDVIRVRTKGRGFNSIRDYLYIDESD